MTQLDFYHLDKSQRPSWANRFSELTAWADPRLVKKFMAFHGLNPEVFKLFEKFSWDAKNAGRPRFSHWMVAQRIRWYSAVETTGKEFKLSNDYIALYARLLIATQPAFEGFFQLKQMKPNRTVARE